MEKLVPVDESQSRPLVLTMAPRKRGRTGWCRVALVHGPIVFIVFSTRAISNEAVPAIGLA